MKTLFVVLGPTGVGKTDLCLSVARHMDSPVINADSRQIFAELPIGTAAPTKEQQQMVRHYFVGNHHLQDYYSASMYEHDAVELAMRLFNGSEDGVSHDRLLLSGGSMMYIGAVCEGIDDMPTVPDTIRNQLKARLAQEGLQPLLDELKRLDPVHWAVVDRHNPRRVVHALELCLTTGKTYTSLRTHTKKQRPFRIVKIGLDRPREELYERINARVIDMINRGLEQEARAVYRLRGFNSLNTVGYKELFAWFDGSISREEAVRQIQSNTRRYMRKQLTWFRHDSSIKWFAPGDIEDILNYIDSFSA